MRYRVYGLVSGECLGLQCLRFLAASFSALPAAAEVQADRLRAGEDAEPSGGPTKLTLNRKPRTLSLKPET